MLYTVATIDNDHNRYSTEVGRVPHVTRIRCTEHEFTGGNTRRGPLGAMSDTLTHEPGSRQTMSHTTGRPGSGWNTSEATQVQRPSRLAKTECSNGSSMSTSVLICRVNEEAEEVTAGLGPKERQ